MGWVLPDRNPCGCTELRLAGLNMLTPRRPAQLTYHNAPGITDNRGEIIQLHNCSKREWFRTGVIHKKVKKSNGACLSSRRKRSTILSPVEITQILRGSFCTSLASGGQTCFIWSFDLLWNRRTHAHIMYWTFALRVRVYIHLMTVAPPTQVRKGTPTPLSNLAS